MKVCRIFNHKFVLGISNLLFSACGLILLIAGFYLLADHSRILLSRVLGAGSDILSELPQPLFYYIALGIVGVGMIALFASMIGWWAICLNTYCFLSFYFLIVLFLLIVEFGICLLITMWPHCLGLNLDETVMVKALQGSYGVPGQEQLTAAVDLAQTYFNCCAINSNINYDTSLWRLQGYGQREWTVPLTCCFLENRNEFGSYLDPKPLNLTVCQSVQRLAYEKARHIEGCLDKIDLWYRNQYAAFLVATLVVALVEFIVLLSIILNCTKLAKKTNQKIIVTPKTVCENVYSENIDSSVLGHDHHIDETREIYIQPPDLYQNKHSTTFKPLPSKYQYHISKSYLV